MRCSVIFSRVMFASVFTASILFLMSFQIDKQYINFEKQYNLTKIIAGVDKSNYLKDLLKRGEKEEFKLYRVSDFKIGNADLYKRNKAWLKETDTIIQYDWDIQMSLKSNGNQFGVFHYKGDTILIVNIEPKPKVWRVRHFLLTKCTPEEIIWHDLDAIRHFMYYHFKVNKRKDK